MNHKDYMKVTIKKIAKTNINIDSSSEAEQVFR